VRHSRHQCCSWECSFVWYASIRHEKKLPQFPSSKISNCERMGAPRTGLYLALRFSRLLMEFAVITGAPSGSHVAPHPPAQRNDP